MFDLDIFYLQQTEETFLLMRRLGRAFHKVARRRQRGSVYLYPHHDDRCFCRARKKCACTMGPAAPVDRDGRCVLCVQPRTCDCLALPLNFYQTMMKTVPDEVSIASEAVKRLRFVSHAAHKAYKMWIGGHLGLHALVAEYRESSLMVAQSDAIETVVGKHVGCRVGHCSRCEGDIHECNCSMFTCQCAVCIWARQVMRDWVMPTGTVPDIDDHYRGDKPQRYLFRSLGDKSERDSRNDADLLDKHRRRRRRSYLRYLRRTPEVLAEQRSKRALLGLGLFDESLDSDVHPDDAN